MLRSEIMRSVKSVDTQPEKALWKLIHGMGYRYRLHRNHLPGKPDLVFASRKRVIFMHGCFWHGHSCGRCARVPIANRIIGWARYPGTGSGIALLFKG